jgi:hypothetical protein
MIVRLMGEAQYRVDDGLHATLNDLDQQAGAAVEAGDEVALQRLLGDMGERVRADGERLPDDSLDASDLIIPPPDLSLEEARELFSEEGLIPDLPAR